MPQSKFDIASQIEGSFDQIGLKVKGASANALTLKPNETLSAARILNLIVNNADRTINLGGNLTLANAFSTSGAFALTLTTTAATNVTLPTTGTLATLAGTETFSDKTLASPIIESAIRTSSPSFSVFNATATTIFAFGGTTTCNIGYSGTDNSTINISTGAVASTKTKTINIGTGGASGSIANINIGSSTSGSVNNITLNGLVNGGLGFPPNISALNGTWIGWNSGGLGESIFANFRQNGTGGFDFKIYGLDASLISTPLQIKSASVDITVAALNFTNATAAAISFGVGGANLPSFTTRSTGTKAVYYQTLSGSSVDYARGIASATLWDSIPQATSSYSYKLYGGTTQILQVRGDGLMALAATSNPSFKFKENGFNDTAGIFFNSGGTGDSNYLGLTGSSSDLDPASQTLGFKVTQSGKCLAASRTAGLGYELGVSITQATSKSTTISSNNLSGEITTHNAALAATTTVNFTFTNTAIAVGDHILFSHVGGGTLGNYLAQGVCAAGSATVSLRNLTAGSLSDAVQLKFTVIKGANS